MDESTLSAESRERRGETSSTDAPAAAPGPSLQLLGEAVLKRRQRVGHFLRRVYDKAAEDNIFFMAGAISFNVILAIIPLLLLIVGVSGYVLSARYADPGRVLVPLLLESVPAVGGEIDLVATVQGTINNIIGDRTGISIVGAVLFIWLSTRLVGTLRTVLREVFDVGEDRGIVKGKIFDAQIVVIGGVLFTLNIGITVVLEAARDYGIELLGLEGGLVTATQQLFGHGLAFVSIWVLFVLVYRFLPARWIPWRTALIAATFTAVLHEVMKAGFSWYVTGMANYRTTYGNLTVLAILFFWIYYGSIVFILGGEVAQVWTMKRARRLRAARAVRSARANDDEGETA